RSTVECQAVNLAVGIRRRGAVPHSALHGVHRLHVMLLAGLGIKANQFAGFRAEIDQAVMDQRTRYIRRVFRHPPRLVLASGRDSSLSVWLHGNDGAALG